VEGNRFDRAASDLGGQFALRQSLGLSDFALRRRQARGIQQLPGPDPADRSADSEGLQRRVEVLPFDVDHVAVAAPAVGHTVRGVDIDVGRMELRVDRGQRAHCVLSLDQQRGVGAVEAAVSRWIEQGRGGKPPHLYGLVKDLDAWLEAGVDGDLPGDPNAEAERWLAGGQ